MNGEVGDLGWIFRAIEYREVYKGYGVVFFF